MDPTTIVFTMWIGSFALRGTNDVFIGKACASDRACAGMHLIRPTFDAEFEVVQDHDASIEAAP
jgi:hypothetical protein